MKAWSELLPDGAGQGGVVFGERHNEVTIELRAKYKNFLQAIVEKLAENVSLSLSFTGTGTEVHVCKAKSLFIMSSNIVLLT